MTKEIKLTKGKVTLVNDEDFEWLNQWRWHSAKGERYAGRRDMKTKKIILMHRQIMNPPADMVVDHKNGDTLDNRKNNLRICTKAENQRNHKRLKNNTSGYTGVSFRKDTKKWFAHIGDKLSGTFGHLGNFLTPEDAARAYDKKAGEVFGEFARLNFPNESNSSFDVNSVRTSARKLTKELTMIIRNSKEPTRVLCERHALSRSTIKKIRAGTYKSEIK